MKDSKTKIWLMLTIVMGIVTSLIVTNYLKGLEATAAKGDTVSVVIAKEKLNSGTLITSDMVKIVAIPTHNAPKDAMSDITQVVNKFTKVDLWPDDFVFEEKLTTADTTSELMFKIPKGKRAITININPNDGVGGHIKPGHFVDLLFKYKISDKPAGNKVSTIMQKIQVLAVGADLKKKEGIQEVDNLTLAVSPKQAQLITLAEGSIKLILRSTNDSETVDINSSNLKNLQDMNP